MNYYIEAFKKYAVFSGRASRKEYWYFILFNLIFATLLILAGAFLDAFIYLYVIYFFAALLPSIAVGVRRLHDINQSGGWIFISLVPLIGPITLIILLAIKGQASENQYGPVPKEVADNNIGDRKSVSDREASHSSYFCSQCGSKLSADSKFCTQCGTKR